MSTHRFIQVAAAGFVFAGAYLVFEYSEVANASEQLRLDAIDQTRRDDSAAGARLLTGDATKPAAKKPEEPQAKSNRLLLPDGTTVPVLNGAFGAPEMGWPDERPWSPIIGKEMDRNGLEWYVHEDGSKSTTQNLYHTHTGGMAPVTNVFNPAKVLPMDPDEIETKEKKAARKKALQDAKKKGSGKE